VNVNGRPSTTRLGSECNIYIYIYIYIYINKLVHMSFNTGLGSTTSAPRGRDIEDHIREVRAGRSQGSRPIRSFFVFKLYELAPPHPYRIAHYSVNVNGRPSTTRLGRKCNKY